MTEKTNILPVITWRWLGVNDEDIEIRDHPVAELSVGLRGGKNAKAINLKRVAEVEELFKDFDNGVGKLWLKNHMEFLAVGYDISAGDEAVIIDLSCRKGLLSDHHIITVGEGERANVILKYSAPIKNYSSLIRIVAGKNSTVNITRIGAIEGAEEGLCAITAIAEEGAEVNLISFEMGGKRSLSNFQIELLGKGASGNIDTVYFGAGDDMLDLSYRLNFHGKKTSGRIKSIGVLKDRAKKTFKGTLDFKRGSAGAVGDESEEVTLLSDEVRARSVPSLLSAEGDVLGNHAVSAGRLDEELMFYLMSRGFSEAQARKSLLMAKISPLVARLENEELEEEIYDYLDNILERQGKHMKKKADFKNIRKDFPLLAEGEGIIYFDSGATAQKPASVIAAINRYYKSENANPHRGAYKLSEKSTAVYEDGRAAVANFIGAKSADEIIFTSGTTEGINLVAYSYGLNFLGAGDEIVLSILEHHSNLVPWQFVAEKTGAILKYIYCDENGEISPEAAQKIIGKKTKLVAITAMSNALGTIPPLKEIIALAHEHGAVVLVDGAQAAPHMDLNIAELGADFYAFSGHKMFAEMGVGVLYGKGEILEKMPPFKFGGDMIEYVEEQKTTFAPAPARFEAGTQNVGGVASLAAAIEYYSEFDMVAMEDYERELMIYAYEKMANIEGIILYGTRDFSKRGPIVLFNVNDVHPHDVASFLDASGICIRAGHHCTQPLHAFLSIKSSCRISFSIYNTKAEIDVFVDKLAGIRKWMGF